MIETSRNVEIETLKQLNTNCAVWVHMQKRAIRRQCCF